MGIPYTKDNNAIRCYFLVLFKMGIDKEVLNKTFTNILNSRYKTTAWN